MVLEQCCFRLCRLRRFFRNVAFAEFFCKMSLSQGSARFRFLFLLFVGFFCSRLFAKFFDLRSWLSVSSPHRSVGTLSPLPRGSFFYQTRRKPCTLSISLGTVSKGLASQEIRKKELRLSENRITKREPFYCLRMPYMVACFSHGFYLDRARR